MKEKFDRNKKYGDIRDIGLDSNAPVEERIKTIENHLKLYYGIICDSKVKRALISSLENTLTEFNKDYVLDYLKKILIIDKTVSTKDDSLYEARNILCDLPLSDTLELLSSLGNSFAYYDLKDMSNFTTLNDFYVDLIDKYHGNIEEAQKGTIILDNIDYFAWKNNRDYEYLFYTNFTNLICLLNKADYRVYYNGQEIDFDSKKVSIICLGNYSEFKDLPFELLARLVMLKRVNVKDNDYSI